MNWCWVSDKNGKSCGSAGICMAGDGFDPDHIVHRCMDAARWACEIQAHRDRKDYASADARRIWVESGGDMVLQTNAYTIVISVYGLNEVMGPSVDEITNRLLTENSLVEDLDPSKTGAIIVVCPQ